MTAGPLRVAFDLSATRLSDAGRGPLTRARPATVVTIHDLAALDHPETLSRWNRVRTQRTLLRLLTAADAVIAVSQDTADGVARLAPTVASRIHVVPNGVAAFWGEPAAPTAQQGPYVLVVGTPEPRKNLARLAEAMRRRRAAGAPERLIHVGGAGWGDAELPDEPWIERLGRIGDLQLRALYRGASALAIPSLHEGSGLPVLEAFAAGAPVVAARAGALPETCGDAAALVDPLDVDAIAQGIDEAIGRRDELVAAGRAIAADATWERAAAQVAAVYRTVV